MNGDLKHSTAGDAPRSEAELEELLSAPDGEVVAAMGALEGDVLVLGGGGKIGPALARMARQASDEAGAKRRVTSVSRFTQAGLRQRLQDDGIETVACDLLDPAAIAALPEAANVVFMAGMKFGTSGAAAAAWATNCYLPALVCRKFTRSRVVAFSTGNVYGLTPVVRGGSVESDQPNPLGDYAMSALGRERMFEHFSRTLDIPVAMLRLNYATELRYGVLVDLARGVQAGHAIDLTMGYVNVIWLAEANAMALKAFAHAASPPLVVNVSGPETLSVRRACGELGRLLGREPVLSNGELGFGLLGRPRMSADEMIRWTAHWLERGGPLLEKPTHFQVRDGKF